MQCSSLFIKAIGLRNLWLNQNPKPSISIKQSNVVLIVIEIKYHNFHAIMLYRGVKVISYETLAPYDLTFKVVIVPFIVKTGKRCFFLLHYPTKADRIRVFIAIDNLSEMFEYIAQGNLNIRDITGEMWFGMDKT